MTSSLIALFTKNRTVNDSLQKERDELIKAADSVRDELRLVHHRLDYTTEPLLIESIIYEINALQKKYDYYIRQCKEKGFVADGFNRVS